ncbi:MAG: O-succinylhomoserine sulfhydrylase [Neisseriaceae bacterium]|nr:O-succinylhomoserine sulfhydrylase [Neisseriaceae bacterium]
MQSLLKPETLAIRGARTQTAYHEHAQALFLSSSFLFETAEDAQALFLGEKDGYTYSRTANPTVDAFASRVAQLENAESGIATATGMAAVQATFLSFLKAGDHLLASSALFGSNIGLINTLPNFGIEVSYVASNKAEDWQAAVRANTKMLFVETPSNPTLSLFDIRALSEIAHQNNALLAVDNSFLTPAIQQPIALGADLSVSSATKGIDGQGRVMGGVICGSNSLIEQVFLHTRTAGQSLSPFNAWVLSSGLETLFVRCEKQADNAYKLAQYLQNHPKIQQVNYPFLATHPQYALAQKQQQSGGVLIAVYVKGEKQQAWQVVDHLKLFSKTGNLGDVRSMITHPYTTTHARVPDAEKIAANITPNLLRLSIGLEHIDDLIADWDRVLESI